MDHILISKKNIENTGEAMKLHCIYCNKDTEHKVGYMGMLCLECGLEMFDFDSWHDVYKHIKNNYNLQRKDIAKLLKLRPSTISTYQHTRIGFLVDELLKLHHAGKLRKQLEGDSKVTQNS